VEDGDVVLVFTANVIQTPARKQQGLWLLMRSAAEIVHLGSGEANSFECRSIAGECKVMVSGSVDSLIPRQGDQETFDTAHSRISGNV
jgi:hypothetical protein